MLRNECRGGRAAPAAGQQQHRRRQQQRPLTRVGALLVGEDDVDGGADAAAAVGQRRELAGQGALRVGLRRRRRRQLRGAPLDELKDAAHGGVRLAQAHQCGLLRRLQRRLPLQRRVLQRQRQLLLAVQVLKGGGGLGARRPRLRQPLLLQRRVLAQQAQRGLGPGLERGGVARQRGGALGDGGELLACVARALGQPVQHVFCVPLKVLVLQVQAHAAGTAGGGGGAQGAARQLVSCEGNVRPEGGSRQPALPALPAVLGKAQAAAGGGGSARSEPQQAAAGSSSAGSSSACARTCRRG